MRIEFQNKTVWFYSKKGKITKSIYWQYCPNWERPIYSVTTNGARKGVKQDTCFDLNIHFWKFVFSYTNYSYNHHLQ